MSTRSVFHCLECTKCVGGWGFAPDPTGEAYSAPRPLAGKEGACRPLPKNSNPLSALRASILAPTALDLGAYGASILTPQLIFHNSHTGSAINERIDAARRLSQCTCRGFGFKTDSVNS